MNSLTFCFFEGAKGVRRAAEPGKPESVARCCWIQKAGVLQDGNHRRSPHRDPDTSRPPPRLTTDPCSAVSGLAELSLHFLWSARGQRECGQSRVRSPAALPQPAALLPGPPGSGARRHQVGLLRQAGRRGECPSRVARQRRLLYPVVAGCHPKSPLFR